MPMSAALSLPPDPWPSRMRSFAGSGAGQVYLGPELASVDDFWTMTGARTRAGADHGP